MELKEAIKQRRSIRQFIAEQIPLAEIKEVLDLARQAPSACNIQGWRFILITEQKIKDEIFNRGGSIVIKNAPQVLLFIYDNRTDNAEYQDYIQSASAVIENFLLLVAERGWGACWINHLPQKRALRQMFNLAKNYEPIAAVAFGRPLKTPLAVPRKEAIQDILTVNQAAVKPWMRQVKNLAVRKSLRRFYYFLPKFVKQQINHYLDKKFVKKFDN